MTKLPVEHKNDEKICLRHCFQSGNSKSSKYWSKAFLSLYTFFYIDTQICQIKDFSAR